MNVCWVQAGTYPRSAQHKPSEMPPKRFGGALGTQRGSKCSQARAPLHKAAAVLPGRPSRTRRPKSLLRDTCVSGTAKRIHLVTQSATATGLGWILPASAFTVLPIHVTSAIGARMLSQESCLTQRACHIVRNLADLLLLLPNHQDVIQVLHHHDTSWVDMGNHCRDEVLHQPWGLVPTEEHTYNGKGPLAHFYPDRPGQVGGGGGWIDQLPFARSNFVADPPPHCTQQVSQALHGGQP